MPKLTTIELPVDASLQGTGLRGGYVAGCQLAVPSRVDVGERHTFRILIACPRLTAGGPCARYYSESSIAYGANSFTRG